MCNRRFAQALGKSRRNNDATAANITIWRRKHLVRATQRQRCPRHFESAALLQLSHACRAGRLWLWKRVQRSAQTGAAGTLNAY
jgi:hypothetical protein